MRRQILLISNAESNPAPMIFSSPQHCFVWLAPQEWTFMVVVAAAAASPVALPRLKRLPLKVEIVNLTMSRLWYL